MNAFEAEFYIKCNKLFITELKRIRTRFEKNRVKELQELIVLDEEMENTSEREIQEGYGFGCYDEEEYERRLAAYREYHAKKEAVKDMPSVQSQLINIVNGCIRDIESEIGYIKMQNMTEEERNEYYKKQRELEERRKNRLQKGGVQE